MLLNLLFAVDQTPQGPPLWTTLMPFILIFALGYFLIVRPMKRQEQRQQELAASLKKNDKIVNSGGIIGIVESIKEKEDEVVLKGGLRVTKSSIVRIVTPEESTKE